MVTQSASVSSYSSQVAQSGNFHITAHLADAAERWPLRTVTVDGMELTYEKAWYKILQIATWLQQNGVGRGDKVVTVLRHSPELHLITLAVAHMGAVISVLSPQIRGEAFEQILEECQPVCLFLEKTTRHLKSAAPDILTVWMDEGLNGGGWEEADFSEVMATAPAWGMRFPGRAEDPAFLVYTGNSAGNGSSNSVLLSHERIKNLFNQGRSGLNDVLAIFENESNAALNANADLEQIMALSGDI